MANDRTLTAFVLVILLVPVIASRKTLLSLNSLVCPPWKYIFILGFLKENAVRGNDFQSFDQWRSSYKLWPFNIRFKDLEVPWKHSQSGLNQLLKQKKIYPRTLSSALIPINPCNMGGKVRISVFFFFGTYEQMHTEWWLWRIAFKTKGSWCQSGGCHRELGGDREIEGKFEKKQSELIVSGLLLKLIKVYGRWWDELIFLLVLLDAQLYFYEAFFPPKGSADLRQCETQQALDYFM